MYHEPKKLLLMKQFMFLFFLIASIGTAQAQCGQYRSSPAHTASTTPSIVDIAVGSSVHTTLVAALKAADLVGALKGDGPFTVFAPTNVAFTKLPEGTVDNLLQPSNKSALQNVLTYHVIAGNFTANDILGAIKVGGGKARLTTLSGGELEAIVVDGQVLLKDAQGRIAEVTDTDLQGSNGVIHVLGDVVLP